VNNSHHLYVVWCLIAQ